MKTKLELIKNYPTEALKNWGDYYGYPEVICKYLTDMAGSAFNYQNAKIAVLDDYGFQLTNYLIKVKNVPLQNIYFILSEEDETKVELMKKWYSNFIENEIFSYVYINNMTFDRIIGNLPYKASTHAKIAKFLMDKGIAREYVFLCPTSLLTGYSANCVSVRENYKVDKLEYVGTVDFGGAKPDVSIYYFGFGEEKKDWKTLQLEMKPTIEKGIAEKCAKVECLHYDWFKENLGSRAAQDLKKKAKDLTKEEIRQWQVGKMQEGEFFICNSVYSNSKADGIILRSPVTYASSWYGPKELIPKLKNGLYKGLAVMFSTNKRDQQARTLSQLPVDLESCGFTEEEKEYLLSLC